MPNITLFKSIKAARAITGGDISCKNTKMLGSTFGLDPWSCDKGSELAKIEGSVCNQCYAKRGTGVYPKVKAGRLNNTLKVIESCKSKHTQDNWVNAMVYLIEKRNTTDHFRWHDAGDLQSFNHLKMIVRVAELMPDIKFWLPTKEKRYIEKLDHCPVNLCIRLSGSMIDGLPPKTKFNTSTVHKLATGYGFVCPAPTNGNKCGNCSACYNTNVANVSYHKH